GTSGSTHGERNDNTPARNAATGKGALDMLRVFYRATARVRPLRRCRRYLVVAEIGRGRTARSRQLLPQPLPPFRDDDGIAGIVRIVLHRRWQADLARVDIYELPQVGDVLGGLVGNAGHVVPVEDELGRAVTVGRDFLNVEHGAIGNAPHHAQPFAALALALLVGLASPAQQVRHGNRSHSRGANTQDVITKRAHTSAPAALARTGLLAIRTLTGPAALSG